MLAKYACNPNFSKGRFFIESAELSFLSPFELDRIYIIESKSFRRLEHKTQVFISNEGDHYRNRLTHSLEAAQIAKVISKALNISEDLAENLTLAHDIGHAPFGHAGEDALDEIMQEYGLHFDHNSHAIKLLTEIEERDHNFKGLNLTWEFIEGIAKHNGPISNPSNIIKSYSAKHNLYLNQYSSLESQVSSLADDIAYNNHDIDDGFRAGFLRLEELLSIELFKEHFNYITKECKHLEDNQIIHKVVQHIKNAMIIDAIKTTKNNIKKYAIEKNEDIRLLNRPLAEFSEEMELYHQKIKAFLMQNVYRHYNIIKTVNKAKRMIKELFYFYMDDHKSLPPSWQKNINLLDKKEAAIVICDFIACMSDRYAITEYKSLFDLP